MKRILALVLLYYATSSSLSFEIVIPTRNNEKMCIDNLKSAFLQNYPDFHVTVIDDKSNDKTGELLEQFISENNLQSKVTLIHNQNRVGALANLYKVIYTLDDQKVVVTLDGDDLLINENVLNRVAEEYLQHDAWITYGQFIFMPANYTGFCDKYPDNIIQKKRFRRYKWLASHLRTFKAKLFKKIELEDLMTPNGDAFLPTAWDLAIMFPMLEMAYKGHIRFIPDPLYYYFTHDDPEITYRQVATLDTFVRNKRKYKSLKHL